MLLCMMWHQAKLSSLLATITSGVLNIYSFVIAVFISESEAYLTMFVFFSYDEVRKTMDWGFKRVDATFPYVSSKVTAAFQYRGE